VAARVGSSPAGGGTCAGLCGGVGGCGGCGPTLSSGIAFGTARRLIAPTPGVLQVPAQLAESAPGLVLHLDDENEVAVPQCH